jgi:hypothetical protein
MVGDHLDELPKIKGRSDGQIQNTHKSVTYCGNVLVHLRRYSQNRRKIMCRSHITEMLGGLAAPTVQIAGDTGSTVGTSMCDRRHRRPDCI